MPTHLLKGYFQLPAHNKPGENLLRISSKVGTEKGLGFELSSRITDQHPAHRHREQAGAVPYGRLGSDLDHTLHFAIPVSDRGELPDGVRSLGYHRKIGQPRALEARSSYSLSRTASGSLSRRERRPAEDG